MSARLPTATVPKSQLIITKNQGTASLEAVPQTVEKVGLPQAERDKEMEK